MLLREVVVRVEDSPRMTLLRITTFYCSLGVLAGGNALWHSPGITGLVDRNDMTRDSHCFQSFFSRTRRLNMKTRA